MYNYIQSKFGRTLSNIEYEQLDKMLDSYTEQEIKKAVDDCCNQNIRNINYISKVLNGNKKEEPSWLNENIEKEYVSEEEFIELFDLMKRFVPEELKETWLKEKISKMENLLKNEKNNLYKKCLERF